MVAREQIIYETIFEVIKQKCEEFGRAASPRTLICDFEIAVVNAAVHIFPTAEIRLCFFHLGQSVYRRIQSEGLQAVYCDPSNQDIKIYTHMLLALAFVPIEDQVAAFEALYEDAPPEQIPVLIYFDHTYLRGIRARGRRAAVPPRFPPHWWN